MMVGHPQFMVQPFRERSRSCFLNPSSPRARCVLRQATDLLEDAPGDSEVMADPWA